MDRNQDSGCLVRVFWPKTKCAVLRDDLVLMDRYGTVHTGYRVARAKYSFFRVVWHMNNRPGLRFSIDHKTIGNNDQLSSQSFWETQPWIHGLLQGTIQGLMCCKGGQVKGLMVLEVLL